MSAAQPHLYEAQARTAMQSPEQLIKWLEASNRRWLVLKASDLVRGQAWPEGIEAFMQCIAGYRDYRAAQPSGEKIEMPVGGKKVVVDRMKGEALEIRELDQAIRWLIDQMTERNPTWSLENPPL